MDYETHYNIATDETHALHLTSTVNYNEDKTTAYTLEKRKNIWKTNEVIQIWGWVAMVYRTLYIHQKLKGHDLLQSPRQLWPNDSFMSNNMTVIAAMAVTLVIAVVQYKPWVNHCLPPCWTPESMQWMITANCADIYIIKSWSEQEGSICRLRHSLVNGNTRCVDGNALCLNSVSLKQFIFVQA